MTPVFWCWTHLSFAVVLVCLLGAVSRRSCSLRLVAALFLGAICFSFIPVFSTDVSGVALGHSAALSTSTVLLMIIEILNRWGLMRPVPSAVRRNQNVFWVIAGLVLYPSATGFVEFDLYGLGYSVSMGWATLAMSVAAIVMHQPVLALCLTLAVLTHHLRIQESSNLWDYLMDPWLFLAALFQLFWHAAWHRSDLRGGNVGITG